jgi:DNA polymerase
MRETNRISAAAFIPPNPTLPLLREAVHTCRGCDLYQHATQPVFGEGPETAEIVLVGEQPGEQEDLAGRGFVGPSGQLLDRALTDAGLDRGHLYITGAVRHFRLKSEASVVSTRRHRGRRSRPVNRGWRRSCRCCSPG